MARHLVLARCGTASLHEGWLDGAVRRNWDLALVPYQEITPQRAPEWQLPVIPGRKWDGLLTALTDWQGWRRYEYIWLPDDDLAADALRLNMLFAMMEAYGAALAAPALSPNSYFSHVITMQNKSFSARAVSFIEIMMPCFRRDILEKMLPLLAEAAPCDGWGMDFIWPKLLNYQNVYVFDGVTVQHTRPVGGGRTAAQGEAQVAAMQLLMAKYDAKSLMKTISAYRAGGLVRYATQEHFLIEYCRGYEYLYERDPHIISLLLNLQNA